jgi:rhodanese-related sulfurtransferase
MRARQTIVEAAVFLVLACVVGFAFNSQRSDGLEITRDYFPKVDKMPADGDGAALTGGSVRDRLARLEGGAPDHGFSVVSLQEAFDYCEQADSSIVFIDARNDAHFQKCHIPNAVQFDYYHPEQYIDEVRDFSLDAEVVIIYCTGGACEDSLQTARYLTEEIDDPLAFETVYVFEGGIQAWHHAGYECEPEGCEP